VDILFFYEIVKLNNESVMPTAVSTAGNYLKRVLTYDVICMLYPILQRKPNINISSLLLEIKGTRSGSSQKLLQQLDYPRK
jgi:hypothetical protein